MILFRFLLLVVPSMLFYFATPVHAEETLVYKSGVVPASKVPNASINDQIYYRIISNKEYYAGKNARIKNCVLQHGHGVTPQAIDLIFAPPRTRIGERLLADKFRLFTTAYFGSHLIDGLLSSSCERIILVLRETVQTSIMEMTLQTERFLRDIACNVDAKDLNPGQAPCAFVGHSKSGAVATIMARRCMEAEEGLSELGEKGCKSLAEIYSAAGINLGASIAGLTIGAKRLNGPVWISLSLEKILTVFINGVLTFGANAGIDMNGEFTAGKTNPMWMDIGPAAPMENNVPIYIKHRDLQLEHRGWLQADYAASAGKYQFSDIAGDDVVGIGTLAQPSLRTAHEIAAQTIAYNAFGSTIDTLHQTMMHEYFEAAILEYKTYMSPEEGVEFSRGVTWQRFQLSDGFVETDSALGPCLNSLKSKVSAATECVVIPDVNHFALSGGALEGAQEIIKSLSKKGSPQVAVPVAPPAAGSDRRSF